MTKIQFDIAPEVARDTGEIAPNSPLQERIIHALRGVYDPELPVNIYDLGLIYEVAENDGEVALTMTLTAPNCPVADKLPQDAVAAVRKVRGVRSARVNLVFEPKWTKDRMSDAARLELGWF